MSCFRKDSGQAQRRHKERTVSRMKQQQKKNKTTPVPTGGEPQDQQPLPGIEPIASQQEQLAILSRIPSPGPIDQETLLILNYQPDRAVREAVLAPPEGWHVQEDFLAYTASNQLQIHLGDQSHPLPVEEALSTIREFSASTVLTARIALALWHQRRYEQHLAKNGAAAVKLDEILAMRGFKKRSIPVSSGTEEIRYTVGYRPEDKQAILLDLALLQQCYVSGECSIHVRGKWQQFTIEGPYLRYSTVHRKTRRGRELAGLFVSAGDWINAYEDQGVYFLAAVEQRIFQLNPHDEQHELRIALYLTERWREQARRANYAEPISMQELLENSVISIDKKHAYRFIPRIEDALHQLYLKGILGAEPLCLTPPDRTLPRWTNAWLTSQWILLPPQEIAQQYQSMLSAQPPRFLPPPHSEQIDEGS